MSAPVAGEAERIEAPAPPFPRSALHVYVVRDNQDGDRLDVRVLRAGEQPPPGVELALLVPLARDVDLVVPERSGPPTSVR